MKKIIYNTIILLLVNFLFSCKEAPSDAPVIISGISGIVKSRTTGALLKDAIISTSPSTKNVATDGNGYYEIKEISPAPYTVSATKSGYNPTSINLTVEEGKIAKGDIQMLEEGPELNVTPQTIDFGATQITSGINLTNIGIGTLNYTISKNANWLTLSETSGSITTNVKNITLTVDRSTVNYGTYTDVVQVTSNGGNKSINISMTKRDPNSPYLEVNPTQLSFGTTISSLNFNITNSGINNLIWSITKDQNWITLNPSSGTNAGTIAVTVNRTGLPTGQNFNGNVTITSNGGNKIIPVTMSTGVPYSGTWSIMTSNLSGINTNSPNNMSVISSNNIWVVGDKIWNWNGNQWIEYAKPTNVGKLYAIKFLNSNCGYAIQENIGSNNGGVLKFNGSNWQQLPSSPSEGVSIDIFSENELWIYNTNTVYKSFNAGINWTYEDLSSVISSNKIINSCSIANEHFLIVSYCGWYTPPIGILKNTGIGWQEIFYNYSRYEKQSISIISNNIFWISFAHLDNYGSSRGVIMKYSNGNLVEEFANNDIINCISMISETFGWAGGIKFIQYINGIWTPRNEIISGTVVSLKMLSESEGYAVTGNGAILKYH